MAVSCVTGDFGLTDVHAPITVTIKVSSPPPMSVLRRAGQLIEPDGPGEAKAVHDRMEANFEAM
eukprot:1494317-Alexandrium_andersonii.AAC.1